jgi:hypothetical protein
MTKHMKIKIKHILLLLLVSSIGVWQACSNEDPTIGTPSVKSFTPATGGPVGTVVGISGSYNSTVSGTPTVVKFNGVEAELVDNTPGALLAIVPSGATTGKISVSVNGISGSSATDFNVTSGTPAPYILSFNPLKGAGLDTVSVTIKGVNFGATPADNTVKFNGVAAKVTDVAADKRSLTATVPSGATTGKLSVEVGGQSATSSSDFAVAGPTISGISPSYGVVGAPIAISGTNFDKWKGDNVVTFKDTNGNPIDVTPTAATTTSLTVVVPAGAVTGTIKVSVDGQTAESAKFTIQ